ncbi:dentin sialophosphoprotein [Patella vulgata]|uniref:dentin sialophosphoprotein n=1 Tax=Patella vulgata TaxID=6465 RepID=UPI00217F2B0A|nr:dentin sialophosphoprotein [Patella vulgata]
MRRRVLKRIITRNGEEIVLHDAAVSPTLSRQSSADISDISEDEGAKRLSPLDLTKGSATDHGSQTRMAALLPRPIIPVSLNSNPEDGRSKTDSPPQKRRLRPLTPCRTEVIYTDESGIERRDTEGFDSPDYPEPKYKIIIDDLHATPKMDLNRSLVDDTTKDTPDDFKFPQTPQSYENRDPVDSADEETCAEDDLNDVKNTNDEDDVFTWDIPNPKLPAKRTMSDDVIQRSPGHGFFKSKSVMHDHSRNVHSSKITTLKSASLQKACFYISNKAFSQSFNSTSETDNNDSPGFNFNSLDISRPGSINSDNTDEVSDHQDADLELTEINSTTKNATGSSDSGDADAMEYGSNDDNENYLRKSSNTTSKQRRSNLLRQATLHCSPTLSDNTSKESSCDPVSLVRSRIKVDKSTQVKYDEIKAETGWNSRIYTLHRRNLDNSSEISTATTGSNENTNRKLAALQQLLVNSHHSFFRPVFEDTTDFGRVMHQNELCEISNIENPSLDIGENRSRQSTVETIDSGIDDSQREISAGGVINGHRRLSRHTYPWEINLDPDLTKGSSCSSMSPDEEEGRFRMSKYIHAAVNRSIQHILSQGSDTDSPEVVSSPGITEEGSLSDSEVSCLNSYERRRIFKHQRMQRQISSNSSSGSVKAFDNLGMNISLQGKRFKFRTLTVNDGDCFFNSPMSSKPSDQLSPEQNVRLSTVSKGEEISMDRLSPCKRTVSCSSDDSYCGFGLSKSQRKDFLGNLANFQNLNVSSCDQSQSISRDASPNFGEEVRACDKEVERVTSKSDLDRFIPDPYEITNMLSDSDNPFDSDNGQSSEVFIKEFIDNNSHLLSQKSPIEVVPSALIQFSAENIYAFGSGLLFGAVDVKNHFQVYAERSDNGCLTVGMYGPRPHCVVETAVNYTGSDIYEITYQVSIPGQYVISVKWADKNIPNSPFMCSVE